MVVTSIIIVSKTSPFCKTYSTNDTSSGNPLNPLNSINVRWDTRQLGALGGGADPKIGDCSCRKQRTSIRCNIHSNELVMLYIKWYTVQKIQLLICVIYFIKIG